MDLAMVFHIPCGFFLFVLNTDTAHSYLEQEATGRNKSPQPDGQLTVNSEGSMDQKSNALVNEATREDTELPEQRPRHFQATSPCPGDETAYCSTEKRK